MDKNTLQTIDEYLLQQSPEAAARLVELRALVRRIVPEVEERMSWQMPTFYFKGNLVHFAAHKGHIGFYPGESGVSTFADRLEGYKTSKGAIQLPMGKPLPIELVTDIVLFRFKENNDIWDRRHPAKPEKAKEA